MIETEQRRMQRWCFFYINHFLIRPALRKYRNAFLIPCWSTSRPTVWQGLKIPLTSGVSYKEEPAMHRTHSQLYNNARPWNWWQTIPVTHSYICSSIRRPLIVMDCRLRRASQRPPRLLIGAAWQCQLLWNQSIAYLRISNALPDQSVRDHCI